MHLDKKTVKYIFLCVLGGIICYWLLLETERANAVWKLVSGMLSPFVVGAGLAFVLNVPMRAIENGLQFMKAPKLRRGTALILTLMAVVLVIAGVMLLVVPQVQQTIEDIIAQLPGFFREIVMHIQNFLNENPDVQEFVQPYIEKIENLGNGDLSNLNWESIIEQAANILSSSISSVFTGAISVVGTLAGFVFNAVISLVFAIYCLCNKETLARQSRKLLYACVKENSADEVVRIMRMTNSVFSNFITGQCLEAVILALLFVIAMMIFRMPYIPLICVLICVTALVPLVGAFVGCALGAFFILVNDPVQAVTFVIMFLVIQQIEGNVIYPRVVGSSIGLPGMWVLLAVTLGGELMGVGGMLIMVPFASVLYTLLREFTHKRLHSRGVDESKLAPQPPELQQHTWFRRKKKQPVVAEEAEDSQKEK